MATISDHQNSAVRYLPTMLLLVLLLATCRAPIFRGEDELFAEDLALLQQLEPFLHEWEARRHDADYVFEEPVIPTDTFFVVYGQGVKTADGGYIEALFIRLETFGDWERGYMYIAFEDRETTLQDPDIRLRQVGDGLYVYNTNKFL